MAGILPILVILLAGIGLAVQGPTNAAMARAAGSVTLASLFSFVTGTAVLLIAWLAIDRTPVTAMRGAPVWAWVGGLYGAGFVAAMAFATPRLGLAVTLTLAIASQMVTALLLDRYGLLGLKETPITPGRLAGVALVLVGVLVVRRG